MMMRSKPSQKIFTPQEDSNALIQMRGVVKTFRSAAGEVSVLKGIDVDVYPGEFISIVGRSGSGKSTLLNMLTGIDHPTRGNICVSGTYLHALSESQLASWRGRNMGIVFQFFQLLPMLTLVENVMLPMDFCDIFAPEEREERAMQLLARVDLQGFEHKLPGAVSGGQQQSAAVARAMATDPPILVADEPTGNLDSRTAEQVMQLFEELVGQGKTIVMVTHDSTLAQRTQRSLIISDGELIHPWIVAAFPMVSHSVLLRLTHLAVTVIIQPGDTLLGENRVLLVGSGCVEGFQADHADVVIGVGKIVDVADLKRTYSELRVGAEEPLNALAFDGEDASSLLRGLSTRGG